MEVWEKGHPVYGARKVWRELKREPHAAQILRIRRDTGPTRGPWPSKEDA